jgi:hypothetical protein
MADLHLRQGKRTCIPPREHSRATVTLPNPFSKVALPKLTERVEALEAKQREEAKPPAKPPVDAWGF